ncbi:hypothetical protein CDD83_10262 [Cordyceps sp. RAO-2017]|nr:hypothetical protein CDD83_10262 [Cordyceps sp. RAO-2017]
MKASAILLSVFLGFAAAVPVNEQAPGTVGGPQSQQGGPQAINRRGLKAGFPKIASRQTGADNSSEADCEKLYWEKLAKCKEQQKPTKSNPKLNKCIDEFMPKVYACLDGKRQSA